MKIESKAPFPWYGGKSKAGTAVWEALGDVDHYVEPFAGVAGRFTEPLYKNLAREINDGDV